MASRHLTSQTRSLASSRDHNSSTTLVSGGPAADSRRRTGDQSGAVGGGALGSGRPLSSPDSSSIRRQSSDAARSKQASIANEIDYGAVGLASLGTKAWWSIQVSIVMSQVRGTSTLWFLPFAVYCLGLCEVVGVHNELRRFHWFPSFTRRPLVSTLLLTVGSSTESELVGLTCATVGFLRVRLLNLYPRKRGIIYNTQ